ncbi:hypothetical protein LPC08_05990 [Roseomonas sp. OT10]|uniref:hypothetical protein n=1 Tax=Roseomonas cutis TaxID=2897332 RepID=UPI001E468EE0|nr:hypothetical protein [Roseomonas sp. OT10]UFN50173.1 hypothetical protein LPC08_05990 [Roseomonas sp. OT10]
MHPDSLSRALRGLALPVFALPFLPALFLALASGQSRTITGVIAGMAGVGATVYLLRRGRHGDSRKAAFVLALGVALAANMAAGTGPVGALVLALAAFVGARWTYGFLPEPPPPPPAPVAMPGDPALEGFRARLGTLGASAGPGMTGAVAALRELLEEMRLRPAQAGDARGILVVGLDGLERIAQRLARGAEPPAGLNDAVGDVERAARDAAARMRAAETEALEVQVNVLRQRLREEGVA